MSGGIADQVLVMLQYHYAYTPQVRLGADHGLSEAAVSYLIRRMESRLLADERFHLPKRRRPLGCSTRGIRGWRLTLRTATCLSSATLGVL